MSVNNVGKIARSFVASYYKIMSESPQELHKFYKEISDFTHPLGPSFAESIDNDNVQGLEAIRQRVATLELEGAQFNLMPGTGSIDSQASDNECVLVCVTGQVCLPSSTSAYQAFVQTFVLAPQIVKNSDKKSFFVRNSVFRIVGGGVVDSSIACPLPVIAESIPVPSAEATIVSPPTLPAQTAPTNAPSMTSFQQPPATADADALRRHYAPEVKAPAVTPAVTTPAAVIETPAPAAPAPKPEDQTWAARVRASKDSSSSSAPVAPPPAAKKPIPTADSVAPAAPAAGGAEKGSAKPKKSEPRTRSLYVNQLDESVTREQLMKTFSKVGKIKIVDLNSKGFAFIEYEDSDFVALALEKFKADENFFAINGKRCSVEEKSGKPKDKSGGPHVSSRNGAADRPRQQEDGKKKPVSGGKDRRKDADA